MPQSFIIIDPTLTHHHIPQTPHSLAELLFTSRLLRRDPDNASAWAHLRGLLNPIALPLPPLARQWLHPLVTDAAAGHIVRKNQHGEGWLLARELVVDLQLAPPHAASPVLLRLARAKRLVERTLAEPDAEAPVLAVRRGYWEVGGWVVFVWWRCVLVALCH